MDQLKQTQVCYPAPARLRGEIQNHNSNPASSLAKLNAAQATLFHMRDGEVVLYRRANSPTWQTRYKLQDGSWCRASTRKMSVEHAVKAACTMYDEARFRQSLGLAQTAQNFAGLAHATLNELRSEMDAGRGKSVYAPTPAQQRTPCSTLQNTCSRGKVSRMFRCGGSRPNAGTATDPGRCTTSGRAKR
jgi:hypothetical protein